MKSVNARKRPYPPVEAGEKVVIPWETKDYKMACCDCGLVHRLRFTVEGSNLILQGWRDNRATAQLRRRQEYGAVAHVFNSQTNVQSTHGAESDLIGTVASIGETLDVDTAITCLRDWNDHHDQRQTGQ